MKLYRDGKFIDDAWQRVSEHDAVPQDTDVIIDYARWAADEPGVKNRLAGTGVAISPADDFDADLNQLAKLPLISIVFPKFTDGRGYSIARRLLTDFDFTGELRATGDVLLDQIPLMLRCGFTTFEISHEPTITALERGHLPGISHTYQSPVSERLRNVRRSRSDGNEAHENG